MAVLPFQNLRHSEDVWLGRYLQQALGKSLLKTGRVAVMPAETAALWQSKLHGVDLETPAPGALDQMGVDAVVLGTVQPVVRMLEIRMRVYGRSGDLLKPASVTVRADLNVESPQTVLGRLLQAVWTGLAPATAAGAAPPAQPRDWAGIQAVFSLDDDPPPPQDDKARPRRIEELQQRLDDPELRGEVGERLARLTLEQAMLHAKDAARVRGLQAALRQVTAALEAEPWDSDRRALKGEIHYLLRQDYQAKTEASVARIKNPLNGLSYAVLALVAGLSTGEASEQLNRARLADPFLWAEARPPGSPPFQAGVLEPLLKKWAQLHSGAAKPARNLALPLSDTLREGVALFNAKRWEAAAKKFAEAANQDEYDFLPLLYQTRILLETGRAPEALTRLRELAGEFPAEGEVQLFLGIALVKTGAHEEGRALLETSLQDDPRRPEALYYLASSRAAEKQWNQALEPLRKLVANQPGNEPGWLLLGITQANLGQWRAAEESLGRTLALNPKSQSALEWRAKVRSQSQSQ